MTNVNFLATDKLRDRWKKQKFKVICPKVLIFNFWEMKIIGECIIIIYLYLIIIK